MKQKKVSVAKDEAKLRLFVMQTRELKSEGSCPRENVQSSVQADKTCLQSQQTFFQTDVQMF